MPATARRFDPLLSAASAAGRSGALKAMLVERFPDAVLLPERVTPPLSTGLVALDRILPNGGLPRGRVVVWRALAGATAVLRAVAEGFFARGERVGWIDGRRTLGPAWSEGPLVIRPATPELALRATEILLHSGGFALIVLSGIDPDQQAMLRLSRMVHEGKGAFVALTERTLTASLRLTSRFLLDRFEWKVGPFGEVAAVDTVSVELVATAPGWSRTTTLELVPTCHDLRLALAPGLADRRGDLG